MKKQKNKYVAIFSFILFFVLFAPNKRATPNVPDPILQFLLLRVQSLSLKVKEQQKQIDSLNEQNKYIKSLQQHIHLNKKDKLIEIKGANIFIKNGTFSIVSEKYKKFIVLGISDGGEKSAGYLNIYKNNGVKACSLSEDLYCDKHKVLCRLTCSMPNVPHGDCDCSQKSIPQIKNKWKR